jgi:hypothetical protein
MDTIFGYEVPMPASDVYIAIATVAAFLPTVYITHWTIAFIFGRLSGKRKVL